VAAATKQQFALKNSHKIKREMYIDSRRWKRIREGRMGPQRANETSVHRNHSHFRPRQDGNPASCPHIRLSPYTCQLLCIPETQRVSIIPSPRHSHSLPRPLPGSRFIPRTIRLVELYRGQSESSEFWNYTYVSDVRDQWVVRVGISQQRTDRKQYCKPK
jgi:hypothetical protein